MVDRVHSDKVGGITDSQPAHGYGNTVDTPEFLIIANDADDLFAIIFFLIFLTKGNKVVVPAAVKSTENRQLRLDALLTKQLLILIQHRHEYSIGGSIEQ
ncbi:hypothetical protein [Desulfitobacterium hafniense]|uniref:hypothetical protein n=1 Tax=Desulfitobacterium hafniense TaxID=49338 RepID=UPI00128FBC4B|nr:hypothetical protein [Desulfitobacterium hafniense]